MKNGSLACSVIIPTYNRSELLNHTLESLCHQSLPSDRFEVLVVDDGSSDDTAQLVDGFKDRLPLAYFFQEDLGWRTPQARNVGIRNASGQVCVFIDSGVALHPDCLAAHVATHREAAEPVAVCGYVYGFNMDNEDADQLGGLDLSDLRDTIACWAADGRFPDLREKFYAKYGDDFHDLPAPWVVFWTSNVSANAAQLREIGMFDEQFRTWGGEDLDIGYRLHRAGARFVLDRRAAAIHLPHDKSRDANEDLVAGNYRYMARKYGTPITRLLPLFPKINPFTMNDIIRDLDLPPCAEYLARRAVDSDAPQRAARAH